MKNRFIIGGRKKKKRMGHQVSSGVPCVPGGTVEMKAERVIDHERAVGCNLALKLIEVPYNVNVTS